MEGPEKVFDKNIDMTVCFYYLLIVSLFLTPIYLYYQASVDSSFPRFTLPCMGLLGTSTYFD
jgi:hypothetical protein